MLQLKGNPTPITSVIFDLGNVMFDYDPARFMFDLGIPQEKIPRMLEIISNRPEWDEYDQGTLLAEDIAALAIRDEPSLRKEINHYMKHWSEPFTALTYNVETFYQIREAGIKTYILSNWMQDSYEYVWNHFIFLHDFDGGIISYEYKINKPDPAIYELLLKKYPEIDPAHTLYIDDIARNCETGKKFGFITLNLPHNGVIADFIEFREDM